MNAYAAFNKIVRLSSANSDGAGILVDITGAGGGSGGGGYISLFGNEVHATVPAPASNTQPCPCFNGLSER